jgi:hypothetical protein
LAGIFHYGIKITVAAFEEFTGNIAFLANLTIRITDHPATSPAVLPLMDTVCSGLNCSRTNTVQQDISAAGFSSAFLEFPAIYILIFHNKNIASMKKVQFTTPTIQYGKKNYTSLFPKKQYLL